MLVKFSSVRFICLLFCFFTSSLSESTQSWNYFKGGDDWPGLCAIGHQQSPVGIKSCRANIDRQLKFSLAFVEEPIVTHVEDKGYTLEVEAEVSTLSATDVNHVPLDFYAVQFHFHAPSEHVIDKKRYDLEMHIVHRLVAEEAGLTNRNLAVVGVLFEVDDDAEPNPFIEALHLEEGEETVNLDLNELLQSQIGEHPYFYAYQGSLTTPPCNETVNWFVLRRPLKITSHQLDPFTEKYSGNPTFAGGHGDNRELKPLNRRSVKIGKA